MSEPPRRHTIPPPVFKAVPALDRAGRKCITILDTCGSVAARVYPSDLHPHATGVSRKYRAANAAHRARVVAEALTEYFDRHGLTEGFLYSGGQR